MKCRNILLLGALLFIGIVPRAESQSSMTHCGFKVGLTSADQSFDYSAGFPLETKRRIGFNVAGYLEWFDSDPFALVTQIEYVQKGVGQSFELTTADSVLGVEDDWWRFDYLSIPILAKYSFRGTSVSPYLLAGTRIDILLGYTQEGADFSALYDKFNRVVVGGTIGGGVELPQLFPWPLLVEARYNLDLTPSYNTELLTVRNNSFDLWVGIKF